MCKCACRSSCDAVLSPPVPFHWRSLAWPDHRGRGRRVNVQTDKVVNECILGKTLTNVFSCLLPRGFKVLPANCCDSYCAFVHSCPVGVHITPACSFFSTVSLPPIITHYTISSFTLLIGCLFGWASQLPVLLIILSILFPFCFFAQYFFLSCVALQLFCSRCFCWILK